MPVSEGLPIQPFLDTLKFEKRYSAHTLKAYEDDLIQFSDFLITDFGGVDLPSINSSMVRSWLASLKDAGLSAKSINRKISSLKSFFKYQLVSGVLNKTPMTDVRSPRIAKKLPVYVQQSEMEAPVLLPEGFNGLTHKLLVAILYSTGIRLSELINLKEIDIDAHTSTLKVLGKGKKERIIPVSPELIEEVRTYQVEKGQLAECDRKYLLVNDAGRKLYPKYVYRAVKSYLGQLTTQQKRSPHVLRHTFATHLANNGAELNAVKELLGHASLAATQVYTHNSIAKLKEVYEKAHPKS